MDMVGHDHIASHPPEICPLPNLMANSMDGIASKHGATVSRAHRRQHDHRLVEALKGRMVRRMPAGMEFIVHICMADTEVGPP